MSVDSVVVLKLREPEASQQAEQGEPPARDGAGKLAEHPPAGHLLATQWLSRAQGPE
jgi:hypothetical protein